MENRNWKSVIKEHGLVLLLFILLTLFWTYPVIAQLTTYAASLGPDVFVYQWNIWHASETLKGGGGIAELYHSSLQFYPHGASLAWHTFSLTNALFIAFPFSLITDNLTLIYNIIVLLNFILAGYAMYLLVKYLVKDRAIAFLVGFAYTFSPLHYVWSGSFMHLMSFCWIPFFFLFFFKMFEEEKMRNAIMAAVFLFFLALASWEYLLFTFLIAVPYFIYRVVSSSSFFTTALLARIGLFLFLFGILITPFFIPLISDYLAREEGVWGRTDDVITSINYVLPNPLHPIWGGRAAEHYPVLPNGHGLPEATVTPGYLVIFVSLIYLIQTRRHFFWFLLALFFFTLSLNYQAIVDPLRDYVPFFGAMGVMSRFSFGALFSLLILFAFGLQHFLSWFLLVKAKKTVLVVIILVVLAGEYLTGPFFTISDYRAGKIVTESAQEIGQVIKGPHPVLGDDFVVLDFPPRYGYHLFNLYLQTFHRKPIIGGHVSRENPAETQTQEELSRIIWANELDKFQRFLDKHKIGYIVFYDLEAIGVAEEEILSSLSLLQQINQRLIFTTESGALTIHVYEVLTTKRDFLIDKEENLLKN